MRNTNSLSSVYHLSIYLSIFYPSKEWEDKTRWEDRIHACHITEDPAQVSLRMEGSSTIPLDAKTEPTPSVYYSNCPCTSCSANSHAPCSFSLPSSCLCASQIQGSQHKRHQRDSNLALTVFGFKPVLDKNASKGRCCHTPWWGCLLLSSNKCLEPLGVSLTQCHLPDYHMGFHVSSFYTAPVGLPTHSLCPIFFLIDVTLKNAWNCPKWTSRNSWWLEWGMWIAQSQKTLSPKALWRRTLSWLQVVDVKRTFLCLDDVTRQSWNTQI